jgi:uncharacterized paraquat-inducible protein A
MHKAESKGIHQRNIGGISLGMDYSIYDFCSKCQIRVSKERVEHNAIGGAVCPKCHHRVRTHSLHPNRKSQAEIKVFEYPDLLNGEGKK